MDGSLSELSEAVKRKKSDVGMFRDVCVTARHQPFTYKMDNKKPS